MTFGRKTRKITERSVENAALFHLQRFTTSAENLRRVLMRKVRRAARTHGGDDTEGGVDTEGGNDLIADGAAVVDGVIGRFVQAGLLDDHAYAEGRAASLHRRGMSVARIRQQLASKGIAAEAADHALAALASEIAGETADGTARGAGVEPAVLDLAAAVNLARRRRLGPFRASSDRPRLREKDLAAMARAGFGYHLAVQVIDAACPGALMDLI
jgi:regulatory protein